MNVTEHKMCDLPCVASEPCWIEYPPEKKRYQRGNYTQIFAICSRCCLYPHSSFYARRSLYIYSCTYVDTSAISISLFFFSTKSRKENKLLNNENLPNRDRITDLRYVTTVVTTAARRNEKEVENWERHSLSSCCFSRILNESHKGRYKDWNDS